MPTTRLFPVTALPRSASLAEAICTHWREYLMEGAEIAVLMLSTCIWGVFLYSADSPLKLLGVPPGSKPTLMGAAVATTMFLIIRSPFGRRSGAHVNPAVTLAFFRLGRIHRWDAASYIAAHFAGGAVGVLAASEILGSRLAAPPVYYVVTLPGGYGSPATFLYEFALAGILMGTVLYSSNHRVLVRFTPLFVALLTVFYYALSSSIAGFSLNPARTFASALFAQTWRGIWIYFSAPCLGMLLAAEVYVKIFGADRVYCAKVFHDLHSTCPFRCRFERLYEES